MILSRKNFVNDKKLWTKIENRSVIAIAVGRVFQPASRLASSTWQGARKKPWRVLDSVPQIFGPPWLNVTN
jgi:hypothetical protein